MRKRLLLGFVLLALSATAYIWWVFASPHAPSESFVAETWRQRRQQLETSADPGCVRGGMAIDLIDRKLLAAHRTADVAAMLGPPKRDEGSAWAYDLGQCGFLWHPSELVVSFGSLGVVEQVRFVAQN